MIAKKTIFAAAAAAMMALPSTGVLAQPTQNPNAAYSQENRGTTDTRGGVDTRLDADTRGNVNGSVKGSLRNSTTGNIDNTTLPGTARGAASGSVNTTVDDKTMASFAEVHAEVEKVNREYAEKIRTESNVETRNKLAAEANEEIEDVIGDSDLSIQEYNRLSALIQQDANLQKQYHRALNK